MKKALLTNAIFLIGSLSIMPITIEAIASLPESQASAEISQTIAQNIDETAEVKLLDAGAQPRQELRFTPNPLSKEKMKVTTSFDINTSVDGQKIPGIDEPKTEMILELQVTKVESNGDIHAKFSYTDVNVIANSETPPQLVQVMQEQMKPLIGLSGVIITDNRGKTKDFQANFASDLDANTRQMLEATINSVKDLSYPLPSEAVGVGAKWQVTSSSNVNGINFTQTTTYNLVELKNNIATINVTQEQQAPSQKVEVEGMPPDATVELLSLNSQGTGKIIINLDKITPTNGNFQVDSQTKMTISQNGTNQLMESQSSIVTNFQSE